MISLKMIAFTANLNGNRSQELFQIPSSLPGPECRSALVEILRDLANDGCADDSVRIPSIKTMISMFKMTALGLTQADIDNVFLPTLQRIGQVLLAFILF